MDGIQGFGVVDEPWELADVLVVGGQKWLRAGWSTGFVVLSDRALERMDAGPVGLDRCAWTRVCSTTRACPRRRRRRALEHHQPLARSSSGAFAEALELVEVAGVEVSPRAVAERGRGARRDRAVVAAARSCPPVSGAPGILAFTMPGAASEGR